MKRILKALILLSIACVQVSCDADPKASEEKVNITNDSICNCNELFLDPYYNHFYTEDRSVPYSGTCHEITKSGVTIAVKNYLNGKLEGEYFEYYEDGTLKNEWHFTKNRQHGDQKGYDKNGELLYHSHFHKGDLDSTIYSQGISQ